MELLSKTTICLVAIVLALSCVLTSARPAEDDETVPPSAASTIPEKIAKTTAEEDETSAGTIKPTTEKPAVISIVTRLPEVPEKVPEIPEKVPEVPQNDQAAEEPNESARPELPGTQKTKDTTTVPPLIHNNHQDTDTSTVSSTSIVTSIATSNATSTSTTRGQVVVHGSTEPAPTTTTKGGQNGGGLLAVQFSCLVASAMLIVLR